MATSSPVAAAAAATLEDLPEDALLTILSLLAPPDAAAAACSCSSLAAAASSPSLPFALATRLRLPLPRLLSPTAAPRRLLRSLHRLHRLLGLWRRLSSPCSPSLAAFERAPGATLAASLLSPSPDGFAVSKTPFLTLSVTASGDTVGALGDVAVCVNFVGNNHIVVEPTTAASSGDEEEDEGIEGSSPPECGVSEMYAHFANQRSPGACRRRRGRQGRRKGCRMEAEHFVRITDAEPTEGICENRTLEFYLVAYDDIGGITCRRVSDSRGRNSGYSPIFWTTNTTFLEPPFSEQEVILYSSREHIRGVSSNHTVTEHKVVSRILRINSSYDVVDPYLSTSLDDLRNVEGRIWQYEDGTFGFGFLGNNSIIDLWHVGSDGCILDTVL